MRTINYIIYTLLNNIFALSLTQEQDVDSLEWYGNWCGSNHGGFQDCCNGNPCHNCLPKTGVKPEELLTEECLKECPPIDDLDKSCAWHDACVFVYDRPKLFSCYPQGNYCYCDCTLVKSANNVTCPTYGCVAYRTSLQELFLHATACYHYDSGSLICENIGFGGKLMNYC